MPITHTFISPLPPEEATAALAEAARHLGAEATARLQGTGQGKVEFRLRWKGTSLSITRRVSRRYTPADGPMPRIWGLGWTRGLRLDWQVSNPFCGRLRPDGRGGSVLTGRFCVHPATKVFFAAFPAVIAVLWLLSPRTTENLVTAAVAAALYLHLLIRTCRWLETTEGSEDILRCLREPFEEVEE